MWLRWGIVIRAIDEERLLGMLLMQGIEGVETLSVSEEGERVEVRAYLPPERARSVEIDLDSLEEAELLPLEPVSLGDWAEDWPDISAGPFVIRTRQGPHHLDDSQVIRLTPGWGFGGGDHVTTRLCLEALPHVIRPKDRVLDVGCGSGVLSIAAGKLGADSVEAVDIDADARRATRTHAEANDIAVHVYEESVETLTGTYDVVLANLLGPILIDLAPVLQRLVVVKGTLLLSGIVQDDVGRIADHFEYSTIRQWAQDGWVAVMLRR